MIFDNIDFHNIGNIIQQDRGYSLCRLPSDVRKNLNECIANGTAMTGTGVELRFKLNDNSADILLFSEFAEEAPVAYIFFGSFQGGWQQSAKYISTEPTAIHIEKPDNMTDMIRISKERNLPFSPEVVRILLPYSKCVYVGNSGNTAPPDNWDVPQNTYLAYGSSITHGSLALGAPYTYPARIAARLGYDYINLGFPGSAFLDGAIAEHIVRRSDWDIATVEMGINMLNENFTLKEFEKRTDRFTAILSKDSRPVFATDLFGLIAGPATQEKASAMRKIVKKYASERLIYTPALELLNTPEFISQDFVHPSIDGIHCIAKNWGNVIEQHMNSNK